MQSMAAKDSAFPSGPTNALLALKLPTSRSFGNLYGLIWVKYGSK